MEYLIAIKNLFPKDAMTYATIAMAIFACLQWRIFRKQTEIQKQNIKVSLLQHRMNCMNTINELRFFYFKSGAESIAEMIANPNKSFEYMSCLRDRMKKATFETKYLFDEQIHEKIMSITSDFVFIVNETLRKTANNTINPTNPQEYMPLISKMLNTPSDELNEKELNETLKKLYSQKYHDTHVSLLAKLRDFEFFDSFLPYLDIKQVDRL